MQEFKWPWKVEVVAEKLPHSEEPPFAMTEQCFSCKMRQIYPMHLDILGEKKKNRHQLTKISYRYEATERNGHERESSIQMGALAHPGA